MGKFDDIAMTHSRVAEPVQCVEHDRRRVITQRLCERDERARWQRHGEHPDEAASEPGAIESCERLRSGIEREEDSPE
ncbi:MAG: hypothetical protein BWX86_01489 [Verrucomicrobia bacterium ADurb.Bin122]|nr:MAG: hypothetical protein BWX86_01489 [Verrucomicrobia bacterium ADurb.Bin122]